MIPSWPMQTTKDCNNIQPISLYSKLPSASEPSDIIYSVQLLRLFIVSDDGRLFSIDTNGNNLLQYNIPDNPDLEAITIIPHRIQYVYLGQEYPATILEFNLKTNTIERKWNIQKYLDTDENTSIKNIGLESIAFVPLDKSVPNSDGYFYVGRQFDAKIFIFNLYISNSSENSSENASLLSSFQPPGPHHDLSSIITWRNKLWFLYDKRKSLFSIDLSHPLVNPSKINSQLDNLTIPDSEIGEMTFKIRGQEGIAFVDTMNSGWVFICIDPPRKKGNKDLIRYSFEDFFSCFSTIGLDAIPPENIQNRKEL